jgi:hypothetical protein
VTGAPLQLRFVCASCGRDVSDRPVAMPCVCGHTVRTRVDVADSYVMPGRDRLRYDETKNWRVKYLQLTWNVQELRRIYAPAHTDPDTLCRTVELVLASCWDLAEWLVAGREPREVTQGDIGRLVAVDPLRVCRALATGADARIVPVQIGGESRAWVEYLGARRLPTRFDALDLAERSVVAWDTFLREHKVVPPTWR